MNTQKVTMEMEKIMANVCMVVFILVKGGYGI